MDTTENNTYTNFVESIRCAEIREEIHKIMEHSTNVTDKVIILMFSSVEFRLESWDYFYWKDIIFFSKIKSTRVWGS